MTCNPVPAPGAPHPRPAPPRPRHAAHPPRSTATPIRAAGATLLAFALALGAPEAQAQERVDVRFDPGTTGTTVNGTIQGHGDIDYVVNARGGQVMTVSLRVTGTNGNGTAYFNILPAGQDYGGLYIGSNDDDRRAEVTVPSDGDWAIRVYLMGNDEDTGKTVDFSLDISIDPLPGGGGGSAGPSGVVEVTGVPSDDVLNVRSGPGAGNRIVGALGNGDRVRVLECQEQGASRWCRIEMMTEMREQGWVNARYLAGGGAAASAGGANPPIGELRPGNEFDATSVISCARRAGQPMGQCNAGVVRRGNGNGTITVLWPDGGRRVIGFEMNTPSWFEEGPGESGAGMTVDREGFDLYVVRIGDERFEFPEALVTGG